MDLFRLKGEIQTDTALEYKGESEFIRSRNVMERSMEHQEEKRKSLRGMGRVRAPRVSSDDGVVEVRVQGRVGFEDETSVVEISSR